MSERTRPEPEDGSTRPGCPECGNRGRSVRRSTIAAIVDGTVPPDASYRVCMSPGCSLLYFGSDGDEIPLATTGVRPAFKVSAGAGVLCHCFLIDRDDVEAAARRGSATRLLARVRDEMRAGRCACEVRNPTGRCCLADLARAVERATASPRPTG